jgi:mono/diheme cytochrome c family protein
MIAATTTVIAFLVTLAATAGWLTYWVFFNRPSGRAEIGSEIELAANRRAYHDDEELEGGRLERTQFIGVILLVVLVIGLPVYWVLEPSRQAGAVNSFDKKMVGWGERLYATTAEGGFNCAGCHGGKGGGGVAPYAVTEPTTGEVKAVSWTAPAVNTIFYRFDESEVEFILVYGRPFSPMSPWGVEGGGPMNAQQIETLIEFMKSIQIPREDCLVQEEDPRTCEGGHLPAEEQQSIQDAAEQLVADGKADSLGEALFSLEYGSGAYSCARCHTKGWSYGDPQVTGGGALGPNLTGGSSTRQFPNEQDMIGFIKNGSELGKRYGQQGQGSGKMPGFGNMLTDEQIEAIVDYVRSEL